MLVYCYHGKTREDYAKILADGGVAEVLSLEGGYAAWRNRPPAPSTTGGAVPGDRENDAALQSWLTAQGFGGNDLSGVISNNTTPLMKASHRGDAGIVRRLTATIWI